MYHNFKGQFFPNGREFKANLGYTSESKASLNYEERPNLKKKAFFTQNNKKCLRNDIIACFVKGQPTVYHLWQLAQMSMVFLKCHYRFTWAGQNHPRLYQPHKVVQEQHVCLRL